ncbi:hypothetical protein GCM10011574_02440 [Microbispora bryophytorum]|uniref:Uncharacterized protein n=1 Tax=Microbispora bryophytorum TaxID=1460882 RepID=A0A8H9GVB7_9ACTN|nr:hypothetical protein GCM10011574_02440 [Microbispora bryophytorum]
MDAGFAAALFVRAASPERLLPLADGEVYAEATARVRAVGKGRPEVVQLGQIIERLAGRSHPRGTTASQGAGAGIGSRIA